MTTRGIPSYHVDGQIRALAFPIVFNTVVESACPQSSTLEMELAAAFTIAASGPVPKILSVGRWGAGRHASRSVRTPFSSLNRPAKTKKFPFPGLAPGPKAKQFGFTEIFSRGNPPCSILRLENSERTMKRSTQFLQVPRCQ